MTGISHLRYNSLMRIYKGLIFNPVSRDKLEIFEPGYLVVSGQGLIEGCYSHNPSRRFPDAKTVDLGRQVIIPGLVDTHVHLPQYAFAGIGNLELLPWLEKYTFPRESRFRERKIAAQAAQYFFDGLAANGTTTALVYGTVHAGATDIAFKAAEKKGLRVIMGKVMMDRQSPKSLTEKTQDSLRESEKLIRKWHGKDNGRLQYALTPRFAITCSPELMRGAAALAKKYGAYIQTHLSENKGEIAFVKKLFPKAKNYTDVYDSCGLLGKKTIMAHCIHLAPSERSALKKSGTKIAHCPTSNRFLQSGVMPYRKWLREGLSIGFGTDVAGGYSLSMLNEMKEAIETSKTYNIMNPKAPEKIITPVEALYLATLGGAKVLSLDNRIGNFKPGKEADFVVLDPVPSDPFNGKSPYGSPREILSRLIYRAGSESVKAVFVRGKAFL